MIKNGSEGDVTVRIVLADDHAVVREGLRALLSTVEGYEVVGEAPPAPRRSGRR